MTAVEPATGSARQRRLMAGAATVTLVGIALSATGSEDVGAWITAAALVTLIGGLHFFGRSGPE